jgi:hypothetical protein
MHGAHDAGGGVNSAVVTQHRMFLTAFPRAEMIASL